MDMKNATILLIFLLCILGLMVGVYYSESSEPTMKTYDTKEVIHEDSNGTITINLEKKENNENSLDKYFT